MTATESRRNGRGLSKGNAQRLHRRTPRKIKIKDLNPVKICILLDSLSIYCLDEMKSAAKRKSTTALLRDTIDSIVENKKELATLRLWYEMNGVPGLEIGKRSTRFLLPEKYIKKLTDACFDIFGLENRSKLLRLMIIYTAWKQGFVEIEQN